MNSSLISRLEASCAREHTGVVEVVAILVECLQTRVHLDLGYESLWKLLVERLGYSEAAASRRVSAARVVMRCPEALDMLRERRVTLCALARVNSAMRETDDPASLLARIEGKGKVDVERVVASMRPEPERRETVRRRFVQAPARPTSNSSNSALQPEGSLFTSTVEVAGDNSATSAAEVETSASDSPATVERVSVSFSLDPDRFENFEQARTILSRKFPAGVSLEQAFNEFVEFYLSKKDPLQRARRRKAQCAKLSPPTSTVEVAGPESAATKPKRSRHIPAALRDEILIRDEERCTFVGGDGHRCNTRRDLQIDHILPFALGGAATKQNLRVLCGAHNRHRNERCPNRDAMSGDSANSPPAQVPPKIHPAPSQLL